MHHAFLSREQTNERPSVEGGVAIVVNELKARRLPMQDILAIQIANIVLLNVYWPQAHKSSWLTKLMVLMEQTLAELLTLAVHGSDDSLDIIVVGDLNMHSNPATLHHHSPCRVSADCATTGPSGRLDWVRRCRGGRKH